MTYLAVVWIHSNSTDPVELFSELDEGRWEVRKVELFPDGSLGYADASTEFRDTALGTAPVPSLDEISSDPQFMARVISEAEFDQVWRRAIAGDCASP